jgi:hypothetical protein
MRKEANEKMKTKNEKVVLAFLSRAGNLKEERRRTKLEKGNQKKSRKQKERNT